MAGGTDSELFVAIAALVVSVIALSATFMQVIQQYYASASGYSKCNEKVMGEWAKSKSRRFLWEELRYEVHFDAPVIFLSPPSNESGPISNAPIHFLKGSPESLKNTCTTLNLDEHKPMTTEESIHTAEHERASWLVLLSAVQQMELKSSTWQEQQYKDLVRLGPPGNKLRQVSKPPSLDEKHTLVVALQRKRTSWDMMPSSVSKPYATTTMCHLVELMAALGVYWKEFDRSRDRYRAEGNGFAIMGERLSNLGLIFSFQVYGRCRFERNRVIPVDEVKALCFGFVPTIYCLFNDMRRLREPGEQLRDLGSMRMATKREISETLVAIGCNKNAVQRFMDESGKTAHLFPLSFEILGMLAQTFHIDNSCFTYLPNPTPDRWNGRSLSLVKIMEAYWSFQEERISGVDRNAVIHGRVAQHIEEILRYKGTKDGVDRLLLLNALHSALDDADEVLTAKARASSRHNTVTRSSHGENNTSAKESLDKQRSLSPAQQLRREIVQDVLRSHIQEVLRLLNERDDRGQSLQVPKVLPASSDSVQQSRNLGRLPRFEDLNEASPDDRQHIFMKVYFQVVRPHVVTHAEKSTTRRGSISGAPRGHGLRKQGTGAVQSDPGTEVLSTALPQARSGEDRSGAGNGALKNEMEASIWETGSLDGRGRPSLADQSVSHDDVWCVLIFRMICWLMLHDFDERDVQISKSELLGSRMPVYIA